MICIYTCSQRTTLLAACGFFCQNFIVVHLHRKDNKQLSPSPAWGKLENTKTRPTANLLMTCLLFASESGWNLLHDLYFYTSPSL